MTQMRLQKYLAQCGIASRRASEKLIAAGRVRLNGEVVTTPGTTIDTDSDTVSFDGSLVQPEARTRTIMLYKPSGYICSSSSSQGRTVLDLIKDKINGRLYPVGRLDKDSEGMLLLTNDGNLANKLTHPSFGHKKTYEVTVSGILSDSTIHKLNSSMMIDGYRIRPATVQLIGSDKNNGNHRLLFVLGEGRNRQIRKMCETVGLRVLRLKRIKIQSLTLGKLQPAQWRELTPSEIKSLLSAESPQTTPPKPPHHT